MDILYTVLEFSILLYFTHYDTTNYNIMYVITLNSLDSASGKRIPTVLPED